MDLDLTVRVYLAHKSSNIECLKCVACNLINTKSLDGSCKAITQLNHRIYIFQCAYLFNRFITDTEQYAKKNPIRLKVI